MVALLLNIYKITKKIRPEVPKLLQVSDYFNLSLSVYISKLLSLPLSKREYWKYLKNWPEYRNSMVVDP